MIPENSLVKEAINKLDGHWVKCIIVELIFTFIISIFNVSSIIITGPLMVGKLYFYYNILNNGDAKIEDTYNKLNSNVVIKSIIVTVLYILGTVFFSLLFLVPGIIFAMRYAFVIMIVADNPDAKTEDIFSKSHEMMKGHKTKLFTYSFLYIILVILVNMFAYWFVTMGKSSEFSIYNPLDTLVTSVFAIPITIIAIVTFMLFYLSIKRNHVDFVEQEES